MKVLFLPEVEDTLFELTTILYEKHYFNFKEPAIMYVVDLECDIKTTLPNRQNALLHPIFNDTEKTCTIPFFEKANIHNGMYFSTFTKKTGS